MAKNRLALINALRTTAHRLAEGAHYEWGHMGRCNCGHLVQTLTNMSDREIVAAVDFALDEWSEHAKDYCAGTGQKVDTLFLTLQTVGFDYQDVIHLENLTDARVLQRLGQLVSQAHCESTAQYKKADCASNSVQSDPVQSDLSNDRKALPPLVYLQRNRVDDVITYMLTLADLLEEELQSNPSMLLAVADCPIYEYA